MRIATKTTSSEHYERAITKANDAKWRELGDRVHGQLKPTVDAWWRTVRAKTPQEAEALCRRLGTAQCAAICLSHMSTCTRDGQCPEKERVWIEGA